MMLSSRVRHALVAMAILASKQERGRSPDDVLPTSLTELHDAIGISVSALEQLFRRLREAGLVVARRGPTGGYRLCRRASGVTLASVVRAIDVDHTHAGGTPKELSARLNGRFDAWLDTVTLEDVVSIPIADHEDADLDAVWDDSLKTARQSGRE